jgi:hypothetical protein
MRECLHNRATSSMARWRGAPSRGSSSVARRRHAAAVGRPVAD